VPDSDASIPAPLPLFTRLWFAFVASLRVLFDADFAGRVWRLREAVPALPAEAEERERSVAPRPKKQRAAASDALALLALLQREGRLVDFLEQDITRFSDEEVGAAARVVHEGCQKALRGAAPVEPLRDEEEESRVDVEEGYDPSEVKLTGAVAGKPPYRGVLRHKGWRVRALSLPRAVAGHDARIVAPAEVELS
jgi:hypothetical protein